MSRRAMVFKVLLCLLLLTGQAWGLVKAGPPVAGAHHRLKAPGGGPLAGLPTPSGAYSLRKLVTAYAGKSMQIRRASDNAVLDIGFTAGGDFDTAPATTHCNATTCFVAKFYDQSGNTRDLVQATAGSQPQFSFACIGVTPCLRTIGPITVQGASFTPATGVFSMSVVSKRTAGTTNCIVLSEAGANDRLAYGNGTATLSLGWASSQISAAQTEGQWHSANGAINGASSFLVIDGSTTSGSATGNTTPGIPQITGIASTTCDEVEAVFWDNYAMTSAEAAALNTNQHAYWGF